MKMGEGIEDRIFFLVMVESELESISILESALETELNFLKNWNRFKSIYPDVDKFVSTSRCFIIAIFIE